MIWRAKMINWIIAFLTFLFGEENNCEEDEPEWLR